MVGLSDWLCGLKSLKATHSPALTPDKPTFPQRTIPRIAMMLRCRTSALRLPSSPRALDKAVRPPRKFQPPRDQRGPKSRARRSFPSARRPLPIQGILRLRPSTATAQRVAHRTHSPRAQDALADPPRLLIPV